MVSTTDGTNQLTTAIRFLNEASIPVGEIGLRRPTLDEVFLSLTANHADTPTTVGPIPVERV
jgi:ABC-2 type transport system ATP-binding protein